MSSKHQQSKDKLKSKMLREKDIASALKAHDKETHRKSETLPEEQNVYRVRVIMALMKAGIPIGKLAFFELRALLEENGYRLTDSRHLLDLEPFILKQEKDLLRSEVKGKKLSMVFDGTSRLGEVLAIVICFVDDWKFNNDLYASNFFKKVSMVKSWLGS